MAGLSAEAVLEQISHRGHLECPICFSRFTNPKILSCFHNFCQQCLEGIKEAHPDKGVIICPVCRKETDIPETIAGMSNNFSLMALVDVVTEQEKHVKRQQTKISCEACDEVDEAIVHCLECREYLCEICQNAHMRSKKTKHHNMASIVDLRSGKVSYKSPIWKDVPMCEKHPTQDLFYYCETCLILICVACTCDHRPPDHTVLDYSEAITSCKEKLNELVETVEQYLKDSEAAAKLVDRLYIKHKNMIKDKHDIITKKADEEVSEIRKNERLLKDKVTQFCHEKGKQFKETLPLYPEYEEKIKYTLENVKRKMDQVNNVDLLQSQFKNLQENLEEAIERVIPSAVVCLNFQDFKKSEDFSDVDICE